MSAMPVDNNAERRTNPFTMTACACTPAIVAGSVPAGLREDVHLYNLCERLAHQTLAQAVSHP